MLEFLKKWFKPKEKPVKYTITIAENWCGLMRLESVKRHGKDFYRTDDFNKAIYPLVLHLCTTENTPKECDKCKK
jgi:hypothetical protein